MQRGAAVAVLRRRPGPWQVLDVLLRRRRVVLRPAVFVGVALVGLVLGLLSPLSWWGPPLVLVTATWLAPLVAGLRGGQSLRADLLDAVQPSGTLRRHDARTAARFRAATLPLYAVADWSGPRAVGGSSGSTRGVRQLELVFFVAAVDGPTVRVASWADGLEQVREQVVHELADLGGRRWPGLSAQELVVSEPVAEKPGADKRFTDEPVVEDLGADVDARHAALAARPWEHLRLTVEGRQRDAEALRDGDAWVALCGVDGAVVTVTSDGVPLDGLALEPVEDVEPYVAGLRRLRTG